MTENTSKTFPDVLEAVEAAKTMAAKIHDRVVDRSDRRWADQLRDTVAAVDDVAGKLEDRAGELDSVIQELQERADQIREAKDELDGAVGDAELLAAEIEEYSETRAEMQEGEPEEYRTGMESSADDLHRELTAVVDLILDLDDMDQIHIEPPDEFGYDREVD